MVRSIFGKLMWLGRATSALVGLAVLFALAIGAANSALAHTNVDNKLFHLGHSNRVGTATTLGTPTALVSTLSDAVKSALVVQNKSGGPALSLGVLDGKAPLTVNAGAGTAKNLSADELDGRDSSEYAEAINGKAKDAFLADSAGYAVDAGKLDNLDSAAFQKRVSGQCAAGSSVRVVFADGTVECEADDGGGKASDSELLDGKDSTEFLGASQKATDSDKLDNLNSTDFQRSNALAGGDLTGNYPNPQLDNGAVRGGPGGEIEDESITSHDINEHGVTSIDILNDTIEPGDISTGGVGSAEVTNGGLDLVDVAEWRGTASFDPPPINAQSCTVANMEIPGIDPGDFAVVTPPDLGNDLLPFSMQSGANGLLAVRLCNMDPINASNLGSGTWNYVIFDDGDDV